MCRVPTASIYNIFCIAKSYIVIEADNISKCMCRASPEKPLSTVQVRIQYCTRLMRQNNLLNNSKTLTFEKALCM